MGRLNQQMDHLLGGTRGPVRREYPLLEAWSGEEGLIVRASAPGIDKDDLEITLDGRTLTLSGNRLTDALPEDVRPYRQERNSGEFSRNIELPFDVDMEAIEASYTNGMLEIKLPRLPEEKPRKITINGN
jgi:HSP20 family protein